MTRVPGPAGPQYFPSVWVSSGLPCSRPACSTRAHLPCSLDVSTPGCDDTRCLYSGTELNTWKHTPFVEETEQNTEGLKVDLTCLQSYMGVGDRPGSPGLSSSLTADRGLQGVSVACGSCPRARAWTAEVAWVTACLRG